MKNVIAFIVVFTFVVFGNEALFSGSWCVVDEDMVISFLNTGDVTFQSSSDETISGEGQYSVSGDTLIANIANSDMEMNITYLYKENKLGILVQTIALNGETVEASDEWVQLSSCEEDK